jgi:hypothetical protein
VVTLARPDGSRHYVYCRTRSDHVFGVAMYSDLRFGKAYCYRYDEANVESRTNRVNLRNLQFCARFEQWKVVAPWRQKVVVCRRKRRLAFGAPCNPGEMQNAPGWICEISQGNTASHDALHLLVAVRGVHRSIRGRQAIKQLYHLTFLFDSQPNATRFLAPSTQHAT